MNSAGNARKVNTVMKNALTHGTVAPGQPFPAKRGKDKTLPLQLSESQSHAELVVRSFDNLTSECL
jgi:hypothetical protein